MHRHPLHSQPRALLLGVCLVVSFSTINAQVVDEGAGQDGHRIIGMTRHEVRDLLGKGYDNCVQRTRISCIECPNSTTRIDSVRSRTQWSYQESGITVNFCGRHVCVVTFARAGYRTSRGVAIGDLPERIKETYGEAFMSNHVRYPKAGVGFTLQDDRVVAIEVFAP